MHPSVLHASLAPSCSSRITGAAKSGRITGFLEAWPITVGLLIGESGGIGDGR